MAPFALVPLLLACTSTEPGATPADDSGAAAVDDTDLTVSLAPPERGYQVATSPFEVPAFTEVEMCTIVRLDPDDGNELAWVQHMESLSSTGTHHMNVVIGQFSFLDAFVGEGASEDALGMPLGTYPCDELPVMEQGFPIFPSQRDNQHITLPRGVAAPLPLPLVLVFSHHFVNTRDVSLTVNAALNFTTIDPDDVEHVGGMVFDDIGDLEVPAMTQRSVARTCVVDRDVELALVSTHTHEWATCATMSRYDGASQQIETEPFFVNKVWDAPPILHFEPDAFRLTPGDGVHWACHYRNDTETTLVNDGTADGEMCVMAAVTWPSPFSVTEVQDIVATRDLGRLLDLMGEVLGPCDQVIEDPASPWPAEDSELRGATVCDDLEQTESNTLY